MLKNFRGKLILVKIGFSVDLIFLILCIRYDTMWGLWLGVSLKGYFRASDGIERMLARTYLYEYVMSLLNAVPCIVSTGHDAHAQAAWTEKTGRKKWISEQMNISGVGSPKCLGEGDIGETRGIMILEAYTQIEGK